MTRIGRAGRTIDPAASAAMMADPSVLTIKAVATGAQETASPGSSANRATIIAATIDVVMIDAAANAVKGTASTGSNANGATTIAARIDAAVAGTVAVTIGVTTGAVIGATMCVVTNGVTVPGVGSVVGNGQVRAPAVTGPVSFPRRAGSRSRLSRKA